MRELAARFLQHGLSRRDFVKSLAALGFTASAAASLLASFDALASDASTAGPATGATTGRGLGEVKTGTGGELLVDQARAAGVDYLFTNPGSFEVGLFDAVVDDEQIHLIQGLHEGVVISAADGYHKVSGKPALVNVHVIAGTAQMAGQLYNAARDGSALVVTAGLIDNEAWSDDAPLAPRPGFDQKEVNRQFTKISWEARQAASIPMMLRRAIKIAATNPGGPTYLAIARSALEARGATASILPAQRFLTPTATHPSPESVERTARRLVEARRPVLVAGDEVWKCAAQQELLELAELLGVGVSQPFENARLDLASFKSFPTHHPLALTAREGVQLVSEGADLVAFVGARDPGFDSVPKSPAIPLPARVVRIGMDSASLGHLYGTDEALVGDVKLALRDLRAAVESSLTQERRSSIAAARSRETSALTEARRSRTEKARRLARRGRGARRDGARSSGRHLTWHRGHARWQAVSRRGGGGAGRRRGGVHLA